LPDNRHVVFLSINRYERKKNLALAVNAMKEIKDACSSDDWEQIHLIMAGGYDERVAENKEYYTDLVTLSRDIGVDGHVTFLRSFSDEEKIALLRSATCLLYTPSNEHFGIVPIEAMFMRCPVIACNSGGPRETVKDQVTGYLCEPTAIEFAKRMLLFVRDSDHKETLGNEGHSRVVENFSFDAFTSNLDRMVHDTKKKSRQNSSFFFWLVAFLLVVFGFIIVKIFSTTV